MEPKMELCQLPSGGASLKLYLDTIVRNLKEDSVSWSECHTSGLDLVNDLSMIHGKCLTTMNNLQKLKTARCITIENRKLTRLRRELKVPSLRIVNLLDRLLDATEHTRESLKALRDMCNTQELEEKIFYRNWQLRDLLEFAESVMRLYDAEYEIKEMVVEELTSAKDHDELRFLRHSWRTPNHALTAEFNAMFKEFDYETIDVFNNKSIRSA